MTIKKTGAKPGNTNAQRHDEPAMSTVVFRCTPEQKTAMVKEANLRGQTLTSFVLGAAMAEIKTNQRK